MINTKQIEEIKKLFSTTGNLLKNAVNTDYLESSLKKDGSVLTEFDNKLEKVLKSGLADITPNATFYGEEEGGKISDLFWIVDPIDGTRAFAKRIPDCTIAASLMIENKPIFSIIYQPFLDEMYIAEKGHGAFLNEVKIKVSTINELEKAYFGIYRFELLLEPKSKRELIVNSSGVRLGSSGHFEMALVAGGKVDVSIRKGQKFVDIPAGLLLVEEAGGKVTDFKGKELMFTDPNKKQDVLVTNNILHSDAIKLLN